MTSASQREGTIGEGLFYPRQAGARLRWQSMAKAERLPGGAWTTESLRGRRPVRKLLGQWSSSHPNLGVVFFMRTFKNLFLFIYLAAPCLGCSALDLQSSFPCESNLVAACGIQFPKQG